MQWYVRLSHCRSLGVQWKPVRVGARRIGVRLKGRGYATRDVNNEGQETEWETVEVRCGGSGSITVDLLKSSLLSQPSTPLILYLPPTGAHLSHQHPPLPSILLNPPIPSTIARINYRWNIATSSLRTPHYKTPLFDSKKHPFPIPVHDVLTAYEWLTTVYLPQYSSSPPPSPASDKRSAASRAASISARRSVTKSPSKSLYAQSTSPSRKIIQRPLLIYGDFLGGTLATSLALTESFSSKQTPTRIAGLIAKNGVYDWLDIASSIPPSQPQLPATESTELASDGAPLSPPPSPTSALEPSIELAAKPSTENGPNEKVWDQTHLYSLRQTLFSTPSQAFDPFASPTQFFHTAGIAVPSCFPLSSPNTPPSSPDDVFSTLLPGTQGEFFTDIDIENETKEETHAGKRVSEINLTAEVQRQAHLKFPASGSGLVIPRSLFLYSPSPASDALTGKKGAKKMEKKAKDEEDVTPASQAEEMAALMRRSVVLHEFKENGRVQWDDDVDPAEEAEKRIQVLALVGYVKENAEEELVREWIEDSLG